MPEYTITPKDLKGTYIVKNEINGEEYDVDTQLPNCSCKKWKYTRNNAGIKALCKHLILCRNIKSRKV